MLLSVLCSERQSQSKATGDRFKEATNINQSLSALGNVISGMYASYTYLINILFIIQKLLAYMFCIFFWCQFLMALLPPSYGHSGVVTFCTSRGER